MKEKLLLGVTKIGNLLLDNKLTELCDGNPLDGIRLKIPPYQRPYKWSAKNVNRLMEDIKEAMRSKKEVYRVGTLILHYNENGNYDIVDGQQRVITFSLLLRCLDESRNIDFLNEEVYLNQFNINNLVNNFRLIDRGIRQYADDKTKLKEYIVDNCEFIVIITNSQSEAFQFFDSQNARGKTLYPHDLLKAYHLREMKNLSKEQIEVIVKYWEDMDQSKLSNLFNEYLYRLKEWINGNCPDKLTEHNIEVFKGISGGDNYPYSQYYKGALFYAENINNSNIPFVVGINSINAFQINTPIIAGEPFFKYARHYYNILEDIQNNSKYEGDFVNDNIIVKTLDLSKYKNGTGNLITRLMFDVAILYYVDKFCSKKPSKSELYYLDQFIIYAFIWAYSMRAQYENVGWAIANNYIMGKSQDVINSFNIYKMITEANSPNTLFGELVDRIEPLKDENIKNKYKKEFENKKEENTESKTKKDIGNKKEEENIRENFLYHFISNNFIEGELKYVESKKSST